MSVTWNWPTMNIIAEQLIHDRVLTQTAEHYNKKRQTF